MPPREAKGRVLTREYMADAEFHRTHGPAVRELYMLLALFTDDAGWMEWDTDYLSSTIYRYSDFDRSKFQEGVEALQKSGRLKLYKCGHALMPKVAKRPRGMAREFGVQSAHQEHSKSTSKVHPKSTPSALDHLTVPFNNQTLTQPTKTKESNARARPRGGALSAVGDELGELKRRVGWEGGD